MTRSYAKSELLFEKAKTLMPGGVNSPVRAFGAVGGAPVFFERGKGSVVTDADDNEYVDFCCSWGPLILGHAHPQVVEAAGAALKDGLSFGACCRAESELSEKVLKAFPEFDRVRFVSSGTEAVMSAIRLARGVTGRNKIIKFDGCYHGHADHLLVKAGSGLLTQDISSSAGVPDPIAAETLVISLDDESAVEELFAKYPDDIAAIVLEPLPANSGLLLQRPEYLKFLREITLKHGAKLIFDEVITGFRFRYGGYMHEVGITPDIVTLGKIVGGGMPVGAIMGGKDIMEQYAPGGKVYQAGTLSGNPVAMAAGAATLDVLANPTTYETLAKLGDVWDSAFDKLKNDIGDINGRRLGAIGWGYLDNGDVPRRPDKVTDRAVSRYNEAHRAMLDRGYYLAPSAWEVSFICTEHTPEQIEGLFDAWREVLSA